jgi:hypothetical protein
MQSFVAEFNTYVYYCIPMADPHHILLNNRPGIQFWRDVMGRSANDFHAPSVRPLVGIGTGKSWEKGMVNVNHWRTLVQELGTENLHVFGQNDEFDLVGVNEG